MEAAEEVVRAAQVQAVEEAQPQAVEVQVVELALHQDPLAVAALVVAPYARSPHTADATQAEQCRRTEPAQWRPAWCHSSSLAAL